MIAICNFLIINPCKIWNLHDIRRFFQLDHCDSILRFFQTETAATEQMKSKLDAKRRENVGRPKKGEAAKSAKMPQEIRATFIVDPDLVRKVKYISLVEGILLKNVISEALNNYVDAWEEKNKKIRLTKAK